MISRILAALFVACVALALGNVPAEPQAAPIPEWLWGDCSGALPTWWENAPYQSGVIADNWGHGFYDPREYHVIELQLRERVMPPTARDGPVGEAQWVPVRRFPPEWRPDVYFHSYYASPGSSSLRDSLLHRGHIWVHYTIDGVDYRDILTRSDRICRENDPQHQLGWEAWHWVPSRPGAVTDCWAEVWLCLDRYEYNLAVELEMRAR